MIKSEDIFAWSKLTPTNKLVTFLLVGVISAISFAYLAVNDRYEDSQKNVEYERKKSKDCEDEKKKIVEKILNIENKENKIDSLTNYDN